MWQRARCVLGRAPVRPIARLVVAADERIEQVEAHTIDGCRQLRSLTDPVQDRIHCGEVTEIHVRETGHEQRGRERGIDVRRLRELLDGRWPVPLDEQFESQRERPVRLEWWRCVPLRHLPSTRKQMRRQHHEHLFAQCDDPDKRRIDMCSDRTRCTDDLASRHVHDLCVQVQRVALHVVRTGNDDAGARFHREQPRARRGIAPLLAHDMP